MVNGWCGMRGAVSLAAALALADDFPHRDIVLFLTFAVIFATLVLQGLTLPPLIKALRRRGRRRGRARGADRPPRRRVEAALARLDELGEEEWTRDDTTERMRSSTSTASAGSRSAPARSDEDGTSGRDPLAATRRWCGRC